MKCPFSIHMDFVGQQLAERLFQIIISIFGIIGFIIGYIMQQFSLTIFSVFFGVLIAGFLTLPPWPIYRKNSIKWQESSNSTDSSSVKPSDKDNKKTKSKKDNKNTKSKKDQ